MSGAGISTLTPMATGDLPFADEDGPVEQISDLVSRRSAGFNYLYRLLNMQ